MSDSLDPVEPPAEWVDALRESDADLAAGRVVPAEVVLAGLRDSIERLELRRAMATLDTRDREFVALRYGADLSARQIAELLGLRTNTVEVALHRVLGKLRTALESDAPPPTSLPAGMKPQPAGRGS